MDRTLNVNLSLSDAETRIVIRELRVEVSEALANLAALVEGMEERTRMDINEIIRRIQDQRTVIAGVSAAVDEMGIVMVTVAQHLRTLIAERAPPEAFQQAADLLDTQTAQIRDAGTRIAAAVAMGTSAENEPAPQVDPNAPIGDRRVSGVQAPKGAQQQDVADAPASTPPITGPKVPPPGSPREEGENQPAAGQPASDQSPAGQNQPFAGQPEQGNAQPPTGGQWPPREGFVDPAQTTPQGESQEDANQRTSLNNPENVAEINRQQQESGIPMQGQGAGQTGTQVEPPEAAQAGGSAQDGAVAGAGQEDGGAQPGQVAGAGSEDGGGTQPGQAAGVGQDRAAGAQAGNIEGDDASPHARRPRGQQ